MHSLQLRGKHQALTMFFVLQIKFVPFNPTDKYTIGTIKPADGAETFRLMKGAPQVPAATAPMCSTQCRALVVRLQ